MTILFCDISDFDVVVQEMTDRVVSLLDSVFRVFDNLCKTYGIQKIEVSLMLIE